MFCRAFRWSRRLRRLITSVRSLHTFGAASVFAVSASAVTATATTASADRAVAASPAIDPALLVDTHRQTANGGLVAIAYMPHGTMLLDADGSSRAERPASVQPLREACVAIAQSIAALKPDLIVLSTPHGVGMCSTIG
jgi:hypothetical protein